MVTTLILLPNTVPVLVSHCSRGGVLGSDLNDSVESHSILEHNYRVRDSYVTDTGQSRGRRDVLWSSGKRPSLLLERASRGGQLLSLAYGRGTFLPLQSLAVPREATFRRN